MSRFPTTRWSAVLGARSAETKERERSWNALVAAYWKPVYKHVRVRWRRSPEDAEDLTQAFFARAMEDDFFASYERERARFRTFLRTCLDRFVMNEDRARRRLKRGGGHMALDFEAAEHELQLAAPSPEEVFDREWRRALLSSAIEALRAHCEARGKQSAFSVFERYDLCREDDRPTYEAIARELGITATTVTNHLSWARRELRRLTLERLAEITADDGELQDEAALLFADEPR